MQDPTTGRKHPGPQARALIVDAGPGTGEALSGALTGLRHTVCHAAEPGRAAVDMPARQGLVDSYTTM